MRGVFLWLIGIRKGPWTQISALQAPKTIQIMVFGTEELIITVRGPLETCIYGTEALRPSKSGFAWIRKVQAVRSSSYKVPGYRCRVWCVGLMLWRVGVGFRVQA